MRLLLGHVHCGVFRIDGSVPITQTVTVEEVAVRTKPARQRSGEASNIDSTPNNNNNNNNGMLSGVMARLKREDGMSSNNSNAPPPSPLGHLLFDNAPSPRTPHHDGKNGSFSGASTPSSSSSSSTPIANAGSAAAAAVTRLSPDFVKLPKLDEKKLSRTNTSFAGGGQGSLHMAIYDGQLVVLKSYRVDDHELTAAREGQFLHLLAQQHAAKHLPFVRVHGVTQVDRYHDFEC
jgi:hypothetical protein